MSKLSLSSNGDKPIRITNKNRCNGMTKKREQCKKEIFNGKFCHLHLEQEKEIENKEIKQEKKVIEPKYIFDEFFYKIKLNGGIWCPDIKKWIVSYDDKNFEDWKKIKELLEKFGKIKFNQGK